MGKTEFEDGKTAVVAAWLNNIFGDDGHVHDGEDEDGSAPKVDLTDHIDWGEYGALFVEKDSNDLPGTGDGPVHEIEYNFTGSEDSGFSRFTADDLQARDRAFANRLLLRNSDGDAVAELLVVDESSGSLKMRIRRQGEGDDSAEVQAGSFVAEDDVTAEDVEATEVAVERIEFRPRTDGDGEVDSPVLVTGYDEDEERWLYLTYQDAHTSGQGPVGRMRQQISAAEEVRVYSDVTDVDGDYVELTRNADGELVAQTQAGQRATIDAHSEEPFVAKSWVIFEPDESVSESYNVDQVIQESEAATGEYRIDLNDVHDLPSSGRFTVQATVESDSARLVTTQSTGADDTTPEVFVRVWDTSGSGTEDFDYVHVTVYWDA